MPGFGSKKRQIANLKEQIAHERLIFMGFARKMHPSPRALVKSSVVVYSLRYALPLLRPFAFPLISGLFASLKNRKVLKLAGLAAVAFGAWKFLGTSGDDGETLEN